ncbi:MAG: hypothetical protein JEZ08_00600 [Clostridiales bacterium]|nr:hypothetical protein [Clostridiales bacterium]
MKKNILIMILVGIILGVTVVLLNVQEDNKAIREKINLQNAVIRVMEDDYVLLSSKYEKKVQEYQALFEMFVEKNKQIENTQETNQFKDQYYNRVSNDYQSLRELLSSQVMLLSNCINESYISVLSIDDVDYDKEILLWFIPITDETVSEKLDLLVDQLSTYNFSNLPMEVSKIEETDFGKIAVINIHEPVENPNAWNSLYFGGSTGGLITSETLIRSFLQKDRDVGTWIDGVRFTYNGESNALFDHVEQLFNAVYLRNGIVFNDLE